MAPGELDVEGAGIPCLVPVPALPSPQQRELPAELREQLELVFAVPPASPEDPIAGLDRLRERSGRQRVGLLGTSIWGLLAAAYARRHPEQVGFVVLVGTPPHMAGLEDAQQRHWEEFASEKRKALLERRLCELEEQGGAEASVSANARAWAPMGWYDADFDPGPLLEGIVIDHERTAAVVRGFSSVSLPAVLPQLACPVLRIHGAHDCIVPPSLWDAHAALAPHVTSRIFERSAHHPAYEEPERFAKELLEWIAGVLDRR